MSQPGANGRQHYNVTLAALAVAGTAFALQQTLVVPALPALQHDLHTSTAWVTWLLSAFLLAASVATPLLGKLGDQHGKERLLVIALGIFFLGSLAAVFAPNVWFLIACRAIQGAGGAVFPLSFSIMKDEFPPEKLAFGVGIVSALFSVGAALGTVLSGVIVDNTSWRGLFVLGTVVTGVAIVLVHRFVPESPVKAPSRLDLPGAALLSGGLVCFLVALTEGESWGWRSGQILGLFAAAVLLLLAWSLVELRVPEPMVDMRMLADRTVLLTNVTAALAGFAMFSSFVLVPNFARAPQGLTHELAGLVDYGFGASVTKVGLYLLPGALAGLGSGLLAGILSRRWGWKLPLFLGMALATCGPAALALWHDRPWHIILGMFLVGAGIPFTLAATTNLIVDAVRPTETGVATAVNTVMRTVGGVIGGQVGAAILTTATIAGTSVPAESTFVTAFWISTAVSVVAAVLALLVRPHTGRPLARSAVSRSCGQWTHGCAHRRGERG